MTDTPKERLLSLRQRVEQQRNTVEALKRDGHEHTDAERQLNRLQAELKAAEKSGGRQSDVRHRSSAH